LTFYLLSSGSVHAEVLPWTIGLRLPFRARRDRQTRLNALPHAGSYTAGVCTPYGRRQKQLFLHNPWGRLFAERISYFSFRFYAPVFTTDGLKQRLKRGR